MQNKWTLWLLLVISCHPSDKPVSDIYNPTLFKDVQQQSVFADSKTFADCIPRFPLQEIFKRYEVERVKEGFQLKAFVEENFHLPLRPKSTFEVDSLASMEEHLRNLWPARKASLACILCIFSLYNPMWLRRW
jgi:neutral trehalase